MTFATDKFSIPAAGRAGDQYAEDVAALLHFSSYIVREARRLGLPDAAEKAQLMERDLIVALKNA